MIVFYKIKQETADKWLFNYSIQLFPYFYVRTCEKNGIFMQEE